MSDFDLYKWFCLYPNLSVISVCFSIVFFIVLVLSLMLYHDSDNAERHEVRKVIVVIVLFLITSLVGWFLFPSNNQVVHIFVAKYLSNSDEIKSIPKVAVEHVKSLTRFNEDLISGGKV